MSATCDALIGQTITAVDLAEDRGAIRFTLADGTEQVYLADGDCCSRTWIESIDDPGALVGATVTAVEDVALPSHRTEDGDVTRFYGVKFTTTKGRATLDYRNESNGYYGGSLVREGDEYFYGGVSGQNVSKQAWRPLTAAPEPPEDAPGSTREEEPEA